ncbi:hypothetical protein Dda_0766 [Drechslerella dactyloides]|uniref:Rhodopsin domain-containing protein n=1 Tax=Drechslerella dactyloides TaxID=74499 RepID=A0AAD6J698_DREDA|nr:hypothetical protein Dda_0766 [Drechslerella dactyloides]
MKFATPPNPQTEADREYLRTLFPLFRKFPPDFQFPLAVDPDYRIPVNTFYCFVTGITDDWLMVPTFVCYTAFNVVNIFAVFGTGLGYHLYDNSKKDIRAYLVVQYLHVIFSFSALHLCRISIQHLLLRLTPPSSTFQLRYLYVLIGVSYLFWLAAVFTQIFECGVPASKAFDLKSNFDGTCISLISTTNYGVYMSGHIILDAFTIFPPLWVLIRLPMPAAKKFNLGFLLALGCFTMVFSALKPFVFYKIMVESFDITWNATAVAFWGILESSLALIIASLPALNRGIIKYTKLDRFFNSSSSASKMFSNRFHFKENIYRGPARFVRYTADATVQDTMQSYLELGSLGETKSDERLRQAAGEHGESSAGGGGGGGSASGDEYTGITVERSFQLTEERASVLEQEAGEFEGSPITRVSSEVLRPPEALILGESRRPAVLSRDDSSGPPENSTGIPT